MLKILAPLLRSKVSIYAAIAALVTIILWVVYESGKDQGIYEKELEAQEEYIETDRRIKDAPVVNDRDSALERLRESGDLR